MAKQRGRREGEEERRGEERGGEVEKRSAGEESKRRGREDERRGGGAASAGKPEGQVRESRGLPADFVEGKLYAHIDANRERHADRGTETETPRGEPR